MSGLWARAGAGAGASSGLGVGGARAGPGVCVDEEREVYGGKALLGLGQGHGAQTLAVHPNQHHVRGQRGDRGDCKCSVDSMLGRVTEVGLCRRVSRASAAHPENVSERQQHLELK